MSLLLTSFARQGVRAGTPIAVPDYTALPVASLENLTLQPDWAFYVSNVRSAPAGTAYTDSSTGVRVVKVTDATTPSSNVGTRVHYSSGGPHTSLPLNATGTISVSLMGSPLFDIVPGGTPMNWRTPAVGTPGELRFAFSRNPATPWRAYQLVGTTLHRINHVTGESDTGNGFPYNLSALCPDNDPNWMTVADDDAAIALQSSISLSENVIVVRPADASVSSRSEAQIRTATGNGAVTINECYISNDGRYLMIAFDQSGGLFAVWDTTTGHISDISSDASRGGQFSHPTPIGTAAFMAQNPSGSRLTSVVFTCAPVTSSGSAPPSVTVLQTASLTSVGFNHNSSYWTRGASEWVVGQNFPAVGRNFNDPALRGSWTVHSGQIYLAVHNTGTGYGSDLRGLSHVARRATTSSSALVTTVRRASSIVDMTEDSWWYDAATRTMYLWQLGGGEPDGRYLLSAPILPWNWGIAAVRSDGGDQRLVAHHYSTQGVYDSLAFAHQSQCGRWVLWTTDHGVPDGRYDVLMAQIPTEA
jgi:hypothetical protein